MFAKPVVRASQEAACCAETGVGKTCLTVGSPALGQQKAISCSLAYAVCQIEMDFNFLMGVEVCFSVNVGNEYKKKSRS